MRTVKVKDICQKGSSNLKQKDVENLNGKYPVYGASGIISKIDSFHQEKDYIAIVKDGSGIGRVGFYPAESSVIGTMQYILPKEGFNIRYVGYCLQSLNLSEYKQGAAIPHIYFRDYGERIVAVEDDTKEQQRIVTFLDTAFAKIDALKAKAEQSLQKAKDLFQAALKEEMTPKEGWEESALKKLVSIINGFAFPSNAFSSAEGSRVVKITNVGVGSFVEDETTIKTVSCCADYQLHQDDIVIALTRTIISNGLKRAKIPHTYEGAYLNQRVAALRDTGQIHMGYLYYYLGTRIISEYVWSHVNMLMQPNLSIKDLRDMPIKHPQFHVQHSIVARLDTLRTLVTSLEQKYSKIVTECDALKQAILKQVFE